MSTQTTCGVKRSPVSVNLVRTQHYDCEAHCDIAVLLFSSLLCSVAWSFPAHTAQCASSEKGVKKGSFLRDVTFLTL